jgi:hypothetical protein
VRASQPRLKLSLKQAEALVAATKIVQRLDSQHLVRPTARTLKNNNIKTSTHQKNFFSNNEQEKETRSEVLVFFPNWLG